MLFPELVIHGHCTPNTWELAEPVPDGPSVRRLEEIAGRHRLVLCAGLSEKERDIVFNTQVLVGPHGYIGKQRKLHLSRDEVFYYKGGREIPVFDIGPCKVGIVICYDNQFPEVARVLALRGAEVILMPHAGRFKLWDDTPESEAAARRYSHGFLKKYALRARENACFAILADQVGRAGYVDLWPTGQRESAAPRRRRPDLGARRRADRQHAGGTHPRGDDRGDPRCGPDRPRTRPGQLHAPDATAGAVRRDCVASRSAIEPQSPWRSQAPRSSWSLEATGPTSVGTPGGDPPGIAASRIETHRE